MLLAKNWWWSLFSLSHLFALAVLFLEMWPHKCLLISAHCAHSTYMCIVYTQDTGECFIFMTVEFPVKSGRSQCETSDRLWTVTTKAFHIFMSMCHSALMRWKVSNEWPTIETDNNFVLFNDIFDGVLVVVWNIFSYLCCMYTCMHVSKCQCKCWGKSMLYVRARTHQRYYSCVCVHFHFHLKHRKMGLVLSSWLDGWKLILWGYRLVIVVRCFLSTTHSPSVHGVFVFNLEHNVLDNHRLPLERATHRNYRQTYYLCQNEIEWQENDFISVQKPNGTLYNFRYTANNT